MIYIYTVKRDSEDWILRNDWYFNLYTCNQKFTEAEKSIVRKLDGAIVSDDMRIETKYGLGTVRNLSSGCKTCLNIIKNPGKTVSVEECGANVLDFVFQLDEIHIYMSRPERFHIREEVEICFNEKDIVFGRRGYENWWSEEYARRAESDL